MMSRGTILRGIGGFYTVLDEEGRSYTLRAQGKIRKERLTPLVGDEVEFAPGADGEDGWLTAILPRRNAFVRPAVANIDEIVIVAAAASPKADPLLVDRMLIAAQKAGVAACVCVTKSDLDGEASESLLRQYAGAGVFEACTCVRTGEGVEALKNHLRGKTHAFTGQSGAGKSSLINALYGFELETGGVSRKIERGKHTTRRCELIPVEGGGRVLDTPGFSLLETELIEPRLLEEQYAEFRPYAGQCRFVPCYHVTEPDCAVLRALRAGEIASERYERYRELLNEMKERWKNRYD